MCFGENRQHFIEFAKKNHIAYIEFKSLLHIKDSLKELLIDNNPKTILFSPVGQSFDEFTNFKERGEAFNKIIYSLLNKNIQINS